jgi:cupin 2 domain-containing protein
VTARPVPADLVELRVIGPFDRNTLPQGLLREHRLKPDRWGHLRLQRGAVRFVWDDDTGIIETLAAPATLLVPPEVPHHLEFDDDFLLEIAFLQRPEN